MANLSDLFKKATQFSKKAAPIMGQLYNGVSGAMGNTYRILPEALDLLDDAMLRGRAVPTARQLTGRNDTISRVLETNQLFGNNAAFNAALDFFK